MRLNTRLRDWDKTFVSKLWKRHFYPADSFLTCQFFFHFFFWTAGLRLRPADTVYTIETGQDLSRVSTVWLRISMYCDCWDLYWLSIVWSIILTKTSPDRFPDQLSLVSLDRFRTLDQDQYILVSTISTKRFWHVNTKKRPLILSWRSRLGLWRKYEYFYQLPNYIFPQKRTFWQDPKRLCNCPSL